MKGKAGFIIAALGIFLCAVGLPAFAGMIKEQSTEDIQVRVIGTKNFGEELVFDQTVVVKEGTSAGEALEKAAAIEMSGNYIETIAGLKGNQKEYWIYYINGVMANVFAHGYRMKKGDLMHWDFHDWRFYMHSPQAMLSAFPEPCLHGYNGKIKPTVVCYGPGFAAGAEKLKEKLLNNGIKDVTVKEYGSLTAEEKTTFNLFILTKADNPLLQEVNESFVRQELIFFENNQIKVRDYAGKPVKAYGEREGCGVLQMIQNPFNSKGSWACESTVWSVTGLDEEGVNRALDLLLNQTEKLQNTFAVLVDEHNILRAPVSPGGIKTVSLAEETKTEPAGAADFPRQAHKREYPFVLVLAGWGIVLLVLMAACIPVLLKKAKKSKKPDQ